MAVGLSNGDVELFSTLNGYSYDRTLTLLPWEITVQETGPVSKLAWTPDGRALAVGYSKRGLSTWSLSGCRLACTISQSHVLASSVSAQPPGLNRSDPKISQSPEAVGLGVQDLIWSPEGYSLLFSAPHKTGLLEEIGLVKTSLATNPNLNYCQRILLQSADRLHLLHHRVDSTVCPFSSQAESDYKWVQLPVPATYSADNWPIKLVSLSHDGVLAAVSGRRGFCIVNLQTYQWRLFGDRNEEQVINCAALTWFRRALVVTNSLPPQPNGAPGGFEILFFPSWARLSLQSVLFRAPLPQNRKPLYVDCNDSFLVLFTTDNFFYQYRILCESSESNPTEIKSLSLRLVQQVSVARATTSPSSLLLLPTAVQLKPQQKPALTQFNGSKTAMTAAKCVVLDSSGELSLQNAEKSINVTMAQNVEQFWMANPSVDLSDQELANTLWAYGQFGLEVWFPFFQSAGAALAASSGGPSSGPLVFLSRDRSLEFDLEVYPIGFLPDWAVVVGVSQAYSSAGAAMSHGGPLFEIQTKTQPFLHSLLRRMIEVPATVHQAHVMATKYRHVPHYSHSLELLLHEVLEDEYQNWRVIKHSASSSSLSSSSSTEVEPPQLPTGVGQTLHRVVELLKALGEDYYAPLVVSCARKTDPALWPLLFHPTLGADAPRDLFELCLNVGNLPAAASYLRVLQLQDGERAARRSAIKVVQLCLQAQHWALLRDLLRFLEPEASEAALSLQQSQTPPSPSQTPTKKCARSHLFVCSLLTFLLVFHAAPRRQF